MQIVLIKTSYKLVLYVLKHKFHNTNYLDNIYLPGLSVVSDQDLLTLNIPLQLQKSI